MSSQIQVRVLIAVALLLGLQYAQAAPDPARVVGDVFFNLSPPAPPRLSVAEFGAHALSAPGFGALSVTVLAMPSPSVAAHAALGPSDIGSIFGRTDAIVTYGVEIVGPAGDVPVLIDVAGAASGSATSGGSFAVQSFWQLIDPGNFTPLAGDDIRSGELSGSFNQSFDHTLNLLLIANHVYGVTLLADAAAAATAVGSRSTADAFIDPVFSFGAGVDASSYSFRFSDGIGNARSSMAVPEPAPFGLVSVALIAVGLFCRRRAMRIPR